MEKSRKKLTIAAPRGFCAGVDRAVRIVEVALEKYGPPVFVRHEIVHNKTVVEGLAAKGAVFVDELDEVPSNAPVVFSAHGVARAVVDEAERRNMIAVDATCPLVTKVIEARRHAENGRHILLIGHAGHPEVEGTMGQVNADAVTLVESVEDARPWPHQGVALALQRRPPFQLMIPQKSFRFFNSVFPKYLARAVRIFAMPQQIARRPLKISRLALI